MLGRTLYYLDCRRVNRHIFFSRFLHGLPKIRHVLARKETSTRPISHKEYGGVWGVFSCCPDTVFELHNSVTRLGFELRLKKRSRIIHWFFLWPNVQNSHTNQLSWVKNILEYNQYNSDPVADHREYLSSNGSVAIIDIRAMPSPSRQAYRPIVFFVYSCMFG